MNRGTAARCALAAAVLILAGASARAQESSSAIKPSSVIKLFDGKSLDNFDPWLVNDHETDPERVFTVVDAIDGAPAIRVSGKVWGGLLTKQAYRDYRLVVEFRWGDVTWGDRKARARDNGVLLHAQGRMGNTKADFNGPWLQSIEFQIIEGGVGDIILVAGYNERGEQIRPSVTARTRKDRDGETVFDPQGEPKTFSSGRINWFGRSEDWQDRLALPRRPGRGESRARVDASGSRRRKRNSHLLRQRKARERRQRFVLHSGAHHDSVRGRGDLLPPDRVATTRESHSRRPRGPEREAIARGPYRPPGAPSKGESIADCRSPIADFPDGVRTVETSALGNRQSAIDREPHRSSRYSFKASNVSRSSGCRAAEACRTLIASARCPFSCSPTA